MAGRRASRRRAWLSKAWRVAGALALVCVAMVFMDLGIMQGSLAENPSGPASQTTQAPEVAASGDTTTPRILLVKASARLQDIDAAPPPLGNYCARA